MNAKKEVVIAEYLDAPRDAVLPDLDKAGPHREVVGVLKDSVLQVLTWI